MRHSRVYTPQQLRSGITITLEEPSSHYLARVLRLSGGDTVTLFNGDGRDYQGEICEVQRHRVTVNLLGSLVPANESPLKITLVQAISRGERMDHSLQKATELGVFCIQPVISDRVEVRLDQSRGARRRVHWQGVVISACEQSGRAYVPEVKEPLSLDDWMACADATACLVLYPESHVKLSLFPLDGVAVSIVVGPEGGFTDAEMNFMLAHGCSDVSIGPRVLRTETAGPAAISILQSRAGDF